LQVALHLLDASSIVSFTAGALLALLVGFEAPTLRRMTLTRRGWASAGTVVGDDLEFAERRFFDVWLQGNPQRSTASIAPPARAAGTSAPARQSDIIGLFPQPGGMR
jgi:hypothetical protein